MKGKKLISSFVLASLISVTSMQPAFADTEDDEEDVRRVLGLVGLAALVYLVRSVGDESNLAEAQIGNEITLGKKSPVTMSFGPATPQNSVHAYDSFGRDQLHIEQTQILELKVSW